MRPNGSITAVDAVDRLYGVRYVMKVQNIVILLLIACMLLSSLCACTVPSVPKHEPNETVGDTTESESFGEPDEAFRLDAETLKQEPYTALKQTLQNTLNLYFSDLAQSGSIAIEQLRHGAVSAVLSSKTLLGDISEIGATVYADRSNLAYAADVQVVLNGQRLATFAFLNPNGLYINGEDLLGSEKTLGFEFSKWKELFSGSAFASWLEDRDSAVVSWISEYAVELEQQYRRLSEYDSEQAIRLLQTIGELCNRDVFVPIGTDGTSDEEQLAVSYTVDAETVSAVLHTLTEAFGIDENVQTVLFRQAEELLTRFDPLVSVTLILDSETCTFRSCSASVELTDRNDGTQMLCSGEIQCSDGQIDTTLTLEEGSMRYFLNAPLTVTNEDGILSYRLQVVGGRNNLEIQLAEVVYSYAKASQTVLLSAEVSTGVNTSFSGSLVGNISHDDGNVTLMFHSFRSNGKEIPLMLTISFLNDATVPSVPDHPTDLTTMTKADLEAIVQELKSSVLGTLLFGNR